MIRQPPGSQGQSSTFFQKPTAHMPCTHLPCSSQRTDPCSESLPLCPNPQSPIFSGNHFLPGLHPLWQQHHWQRGFKSLSPLQMWDYTPWLFSWQNQPRDKARSRKALNSRSLFLPQNYTDFLCLEGCRAEIKSNVSRQLSQKKKKKNYCLFFLANFPES